MAMKTAENYVIGIDGGTESIRVGLFNLEGKLILARNHAYKTYFPQSGWAEQDPDEWWQALCIATNMLIKDSAVSPSDIKGIGVDATSCTVVFLDKRRRPLRKALLWMDVRSDQEARFIAESGHAALKYNGHGNVSAEWMPCKALWVKRHQPDIYQTADGVCEYLDYINYRLTGQYVGSINTASVRAYYDDDMGDNLKLTRQSISRISSPNSPLQYWIWPHLWAN